LSRDRGEEKGRAGEERRKEGRKLERREEEREGNSRGKEGKRREETPMVVRKVFQAERTDSAKFILQVAYI